MATYKVYVSDYDYPDLEIEKSILEPIGAEVIGLQCKDAKIDRETIEKLERCKAICRYGTGVDIVDVKAAYDNDIIVTNVPDYAIDEVADHTIAMAFMLLRRIPMYSKATRQGLWHWSVSGGSIIRYRAARWGLIGFGRIARNIARKLRAFGFDIVAYDPYVSASYMNTHRVHKVALNELYATSDVVCVMCPYTPETHHIVNAESFSLMKESSVLVNCARGKCVDNEALYQALVEGSIASAGLDDTEEEPAKKHDWTPEDNPLFSLDSCFITPHAAYVSVQSLEECRQVAAENAKAVLQGKPPLDPVYP